MHLGPDDIGERSSGLLNCIARRVQQEHELELGEAVTVGCFPHRFRAPAGVGVLALIAPLVVPSLCQQRRDTAAIGVDDLEEVAATES